MTWNMMSGFVTQCIPIMVSRCAYVKLILRLVSISNHLKICSNSDLLLGRWGAGGVTDFDLNESTNVTDLMTLLRHWGPCPE